MIFRWASWLAAGWFAFYVMRIAINVFVHHVSIPFVMILQSIPYNLITVYIYAVVLSAMIIVPYAYVVWAKPGRMFVTESLAWPQGAWPLVVLGVAVGLAFGLASPVGALGPLPGHTQPVTTLP
jgi:hypothetical protein